MNQLQFSTSDLSDMDLALIINMLLTQAKHNEEAKADVIRACNFVLQKLNPPNNLTKGSV